MKPLTTVFPLHHFTLAATVLAALTTAAPAQITQTTRQAPSTHNSSTHSSASSHFLITLNDHSQLRAHHIQFDQPNRQLTLTENRQQTTHVHNIPLANIRSIRLATHTLDIRTARFITSSLAPGSPAPGTPQPDTNSPTGPDALRFTMAADSRGNPPHTSRHITYTHHDPHDACRQWPSTRALTVGYQASPISSYPQLQQQLYPTGIAPQETPFALELFRQLKWQSAWMTPLDTAPQDSTAAPTRYETDTSQAAPAPAPAPAPDTQLHRPHNGSTHLRNGSPSPISSPSTALGRLALQVAATPLQAPGRSDITGFQLHVRPATPLAAATVQGTLQATLHTTRDRLLPLGDGNFYSAPVGTRTVARWSRPFQLAAGAKQWSTELSLGSQALTYDWAAGPIGQLRIELVVPGYGVLPLTTTVPLRDLSTTRVDNLHHTGDPYARGELTGRRQPIPVRYRRTSSIRATRIPGFVAVGP